MSLRYALGLPLVTLLALAAGACSKDEPPAPTAPASSAATPAPGHNPAAPPPRDPAKALASLGRLGDAIAEGNTASEGEGTDCERSYRGIETMMAALQKVAPGTEGPSVPERDEFLRVCQSLPEELQRCMVMSYGMAHRDECRQARMSNPEADAKLQALINL